MSEVDVQRPKFEAPQQERPVVITHNSGRLFVEYQGVLDQHLGYGRQVSIPIVSSAANIRIEVGDVVHDLRISLDELRMLHEECARRIAEIEALSESTKDFKNEAETYETWYFKAKKNGK